MFILEREVQAWCRSVYPGWRNRDARIAELADHLYCEIERLHADGLSEEEAFIAATGRMGDISLLIEEHAKNRGVVASIYSNGIDSIENWRSSMNPKKASTLIIVISLLFAAAIILSSYLLADTQYEHLSQTVMYLLIAIWFIPYTLLSMTATGEQGTVKSEYLCMKRKVFGLFSRS